MVDLEPPPDRGTHLVGQGVFDHGQVAGLDPFPDEAVGDGEDEDTVGEFDRLEPGQPELPGALGHLVAQGPGAPGPKICCLSHRVTALAERPFSPLGVR